MLQNEIRCPLTGVSDLEVVETIKTKDLISLYALYTGLDISEEFFTPEISLVKNPHLDFCFFHPMVTGSSRFYEKLYANLGYPERKSEYQYASNFIKKGDAVLDVGCGWGFFSQYVPEANYLGLEPNQKSVEKSHQMGVNVVNKFVEEIAGEKQKFDVVVSFQVIEHVTDPLGFFRNCLDCVTADGTLIISVPNYEGWISMRENTYLNIPPHHVTWWSLKTFLSLAREYGLDLVDYHEEKLESLSDWTGILLKQRINRLVGRENKSIRLGLIDRMLNWTCSQTGRLLPHPSNRLAPKGHSLTVVLKKRRD